MNVFLPVYSLDQENPAWGINCENLWYLFQDSIDEFVQFLGLKNGSFPRGFSAIFGRFYLTLGQHLNPTYLSSPYGSHSALFLPFLIRFCINLYQTLTDFQMAWSSQGWCCSRKAERVLQGNLPGEGQENTDHSNTDIPVAKPPPWSRRQGHRAVVDHSSASCRHYTWCGPQDILAGWIPLHGALSTEHLGVEVGQATVLVAHQDAH